MTFMETMFMEWTRSVWPHELLHYSRLLWIQVVVPLTRLRLAPGRDKSSSGSADSSGGVVMLSEDLATGSSLAQPVLESLVQADRRELATPPALPQSFAIAAPRLILLRREGLVVKLL